jgi:ribosome-associated heat shock protein Hsp15
MDGAGPRRKDPAADGMRIDSLLKALCLVKTRSLARKGCERGGVRLNGAAVKPSREARAGDIIEVRYPGRSLVIELLELPGGQASRKEAPGYYRVIRDTGTRRSAGPGN